MRTIIGGLIAVAGVLSGCAQNPIHSFDEDVAILSKHYEPIVLKQGDQRVALLADLQGRVMVSTTGGDEGDSFGWFNREYIAEGLQDSSSVVGGEGRLWFGPEAGPYSFFFPPGKEQNGDHLKVPEAMSTMPFNLVSKSETSAAFSKQFSLINYSGFEFSIDVDRRIELWDRNKIEAALNVAIPDTIQYAAFSAHTEITNIGEQDWKKETGVMSIWDISSFRPTDRTTAVIPVKNNPATVTEYFTPLRDSHLKVKGNHVFYKGDGKYMNKIGVPPQYTLPVMGAWNAERQALTIAVFSFKPEEGVFVNSVWGHKGDPYEGDVTNIFNDGLAGGIGPFGPLFELESSSHALELKVGEKQSHRHTTMHFEGNRDALDKISREVLGVGLDEIEAVFSNQ